LLHAERLAAAAGDIARLRALSKGLMFAYLDVDHDTTRAMVCNAQDKLLQKVEDLQLEPRLSAPLLLGVLSFRDSLGIRGAFAVDSESRDKNVPTGAGSKGAPVLTALPSDDVENSKAVQDNDSDFERSRSAMLARLEIFAAASADKEMDRYRSQSEMLERLAVAAELREDPSGEHSFRVGKLASLLAREYGCPSTTVDQIEIAGRLHDIGKVGIPDGIFRKTGTLSEAEHAVMRTHASVGADMLSDTDVPHLLVAQEIARGHHEWWDGTGYPSGLAGEAIPVAARIAIFADAFDAMTHERAYRKALSMDHALAEIVKLKGRQFDPSMTDLFVGLVTRLRREVADLDAFLGHAAKSRLRLQAGV
jgi:putative nucleotidyltransferase with HDIG domain